MNGPNDRFSNDFSASVWPALDYPKHKSCNKLQQTAKMCHNKPINSE